MQITVRIVDSYGIKKVYPVCEKATTFANIAGTMTLTHRTIASIKLLGYTVNVQQDVVTL